MKPSVVGWISSLVLALPTIVLADLDPQIVVYVEEPVAGAVYTGVTNLRGWAVGPDGIDRVEYFIDGVRMGDIPYGGERRDVGDYYPAFPDSDLSGYSMAFTYSRLDAGPHTLMVRAFDPAGDHNEQSQVFSVTRFSDPFIRDPREVNLLAASDVVIDSASSLTIYGARVQGLPVNLSLEWRTANQDLNIVAIDAAAGVYGFESLIANRTIAGQDGWELQSGLGSAVVQVDAGTVNGTQVVRHLQTVAANQPARLTRENDASYRFPSITTGQSVLLLQFDATGDFIAQFALGHDVNSDDILTAGELGPAFGVDNRSFVIQGAAEGALATAPFNTETRLGNAGSDWYRLRLRIDLAANGGEGAGSLFYMNLSAGDTVFHAIPELQAVDLGLTAMSPDAQTEEWDAMWLQLMSGGGAIPSVDNLLPNP